MTHFHRLIRLAPAALLLAGAAAVQAAPDASARERYQQDRQACLSGQTQQAQAVCLQEAGAALQESRAGNLARASGDARAANATQRCDAFQNAEDRSACVDRVRGQGTTSGSVMGGGVLRESVTTVPQ